jgi:hypothetical protein
MQPRRLAAIGLAVLLIVGVGYGIASSIGSRIAGGTVALHGLIGSEKGPFFADARVIKALARGGFTVTVQTAGSRQIAGADLSHEDFAFPAGAPAAEKIRREHQGTTAFVPFFTPMAIATWQPIVDLLQKAGVVRQESGYLVLDMAKFMDLAAKDTRWKDLPGNTTYAINKSILVTTTDVRKSNSAANFLAIASYVINGDNVVQNDANAPAIADRVSPLFLRQGFVSNSSEEPFDDYLVQGMGKSPLVMIYESQFVARAALADGSITTDMRLIYPGPTIYSKHTFVSLTADGARLGQFLSTDPEIRSLATEFGFRTGDRTAFNAFVTGHGLTVPQDLQDVIDPPTFETLEAMIKRLEDLYAGTASPEPGESAVPTTNSTNQPATAPATTSGPTSSP